ncbi:hypothetical protein MMC12_004181 [Toensbergia leucococca]|nr:hypothetical protein [Toensbergia leucococca]
METRRHPLQRLNSPSLSISAFIHFIGLSSFAASFRYNDSYGWHFQYLTIIGLTLATTTFAFGSLADITLSPLLFQIKNTLSVCSAPLEILISILYWSLRLIDKNLVLPDWMELDPLADIGFHAAPAVLLALDLLLLSPPWTIRPLPALTLSTALAFTYWVWVEHCFNHNGWYPYPLFDQLSQPWRAVLFSCSALLMTGSTVALQWVYARLNGYGIGSGVRMVKGGKASEAR